MPGRNLHRSRGPAHRVALKFHTGGGLRRWLGARLGATSSSATGSIVAFCTAWAPRSSCYYAVPRHLGRLVHVRGSRAHRAGTRPGARGLAMDRRSRAADDPSVRAEKDRELHVLCRGARSRGPPVPAPVAWVVVLGTAFVDPLIGELRLSPRWRTTYPWFPGVVYVLLGASALILVSRWPAFAAVTFAGISAVMRDRRRAAPAPGTRRRPRR